MVENARNRGEGESTPDTPKAQEAQASVEVPATSQAFSSAGASSSREARIEELRRLQAELQPLHESMARVAKGIERLGREVGVEPPESQPTSSELEGDVKVRDLLQRTLVEGSLDDEDLALIGVASTLLSPHAEREKLYREVAEAAAEQGPRDPKLLLRFVEEAVQDQAAQEELLARFKEKGGELADTVLAHEREKTAVNLQLRHAQGEKISEEEIVRFVSECLRDGRLEGPSRLPDDRLDDRSCINTALTLLRPERRDAVRKHILEKLSFADVRDLKLLADFAQGLMTEEEINERFVQEREVREHERTLQDEGAGHKREAKLPVSVSTKREVEASAQEAEGGKAEPHEPSSDQQKDRFPFLKGLGLLLLHAAASPFKRPGETLSEAADRRADAAQKMRFRALPFGILGLFLTGVVLATAWTIRRLSHYISEKLKRRAKWAAGLVETMERLETWIDRVAVPPREQSQPGSRRAERA